MYRNVCTNGLSGKNMNSCLHKQKKALFLYIDL